MVASFLKRRVGMAFQEIADHTKNVIDIVADQEHDKWYKLKEIGLEIAIIVFMSVSVFGFIVLASIDMSNSKSVLCSV